MNVLDSPSMVAMFEYWRGNKAASISAFTMGQFCTPYQMDLFRRLAQRLGREFPSTWQFHTRGRKMVDFELGTIAHGEGGRVILHPLKSQLPGSWGRMLNPPPVRRDSDERAILNVVTDSSLVLFFACSPALQDLEYQTAGIESRGKRGVLTILSNEVSPAILPGQ